MTGSLDQRVAVVGASVGGLTVAEALRRLGHCGPLVLIDAEPHPPYDRPPLSKHFLSEQWHPDQLALRSPEALDRLDADLRLGHRARSLDAQSRSIVLENGDVIEADAIVIATGANARRLPAEATAPGIHVLRTLDDAHRLRDALRPGRRLAVVGNGVLGSEIAATATGLGLKTVLTGPAMLPMRSQLGELGSAMLARGHREHGVDLLGGRRTTAITRGPDGRMVVAFDGGETVADEVVTAIGSTPATGWLEGSSLTLDDGVICDAWSRAAPGIWALGDVARFHHRDLQAPLRLENRTHAVEQALAVAKDILGEHTAYVPVPYFWSDHYGTRIQVYGDVTDPDRTQIVEGDPSTGRCVSTAHRSGELVGVLGWGMPKQARQHALTLFEHARGLAA